MESGSFSDSVYSVLPFMKHMGITEWFLLSLTVLTITFCIVSVYLYNQVFAMRAQYAKDMRTIKEHLNSMTNASIGVGSRLVSLEESLHETNTKQEAMENRYPELAAFSKAEKMIKRGASSDDLVNEGMNRPEAELMSFVHKRGKKGNSISTQA